MIHIPLLPLTPIPFCSVPFCWPRCSRFLSSLIFLLSHLESLLHGKHTLHNLSLLPEYSFASPLRISLPLAALRPLLWLFRQRHLLYVTKIFMLIGIMWSLLITKLNVISCQTHQGDRLRTFLVFVILALHPRECSALDEVGITTGKNIHSNDPKMISTMVYQWGEFAKENRSNSVFQVWGF